MELEPPDEREHFRRLASQSGLPFAEADELMRAADPSLFARVPLAFLDTYHVVPVTKVDRTLIAATTDPAAVGLELATALGGDELDLRVVTPTDLHRLRVALQLGQVGAARGAARHPPGHLLDLLEKETRLDAEHVALFDAILLDAIAERASDVHLEIYRGQVRVRLRVDGDLRDVAHFHLSREQLLGVINVLKISASLDIAERRAPQGGRFTTKAAGLVFDLRVQTQPSMHGEHAIVRLLPQGRKPLSIDALGLPAPAAAAFRRLLASPNGLVLVVGPTGSGKSTTLYAGLQQLAADASRKVITIEDPIEYAIDGVQQTQVLPEVGFDFGSAMRAFVREDPDVILVGEVRDPETALEALRASQTGHLVLSTLHCNDAVDAVQRLRDLGMHENSIASELLAILAQRLAKRLCEHCRAPADPDPELVAEIFPAGAPPDFSCWAAPGCSHCRGAGTRGRIAVAELLPASRDLRTAIAMRLPLDELRARAIAAGLVPLREAALAHVTSGTIALDELRWLLPPERLRGA